MSRTAKEMDFTCGECWEKFRHRPECYQTVRCPKCRAVVLLTPLSDEIDWEDWPQVFRDLDNLFRIPKSELSLRDYARIATLLEKTREEDEHPEGYGDACLCRVCISYADL